MKRKKGKADDFPEMMYISRSGPKGQPYFSLHKPEFVDVNKDTIVGVYKFKRIQEVKVTRTLQRPKE